MNANNIYDYLIPVGDAGDKIFTNGQQDKVVTGEQERKAEDLIKQIAMKKQLDLERGNAEHILEMLKQDTPDAAIYRALLLQQLEKQKGNTNELKKRDEDNKPGVVRRVAGWVGRKTLGAAKYMGYMALQYLAMKALSNAGDIIRDGPVKTWKKWQLENGVARTPDLAKEHGDANAAVGDGIYKREARINDLSKENQKKAINIIDEVSPTPVNMANTKIELKTFYEDKDGNYYLTIPDNIDPSQLKVNTGYFVNTGIPGNEDIPLTAEMAEDLRVGDARSVISGTGNAITDNTFVRTVDNGTFGIADKTGFNDSTRPNTTLSAPTKQKAEIEEILKKQKVFNQTNQTAPNMFVDPALRYATDLQAKALNFGNFVGDRTEYHGRYKDPHYKINMKNVYGLLNKIEDLAPTDLEGAYNIFDKMDANYNEGIMPNDLGKFLYEAVGLTRKYTSPKDKKLLDKQMDALISHYTKKTTTFTEDSPPKLNLAKDSHIVAVPTPSSSGQYNTIQDSIFGMLLAALIWSISRGRSGKGYKFPPKKSVGRRAHLKKTTKDRRRKRR